MSTQTRTTRIHQALAGLVPRAVALSLGTLASALAFAATPVNISQVPLTIAIPAHPQVLIAVANSQSMDGDLSGAIWTGSGALGSSLAGLNSSSSPVNYTIPTGFTPPVNAGSGGSAPYTVTSGSTQTDNSASRLNVAKAGISAILTTYMPTTDFALMDYSTSGIGQYTTWVYEMSPSGGFQFTSTIPTGTTNRYITNPCYGVSLTAGGTLSSDCKALNTYYGSTVNMASQLYMQIGASSDDPSINDVLYASGGVDPVCVVYSGPSPANPYPPNFTLANYKAGGVTESYKSEVNNCATVTGPTNAGYVPYSTQVMYIERGFGFYTSSESATTGNMLVTMTSAGASPTTSSVNTAIAKFTPYLAPETNSTSSQDIKAAATQSPIAGLIAKAQNYLTVNPPASSNGCNTSRYLVLLTDGLPTMDLSGNSWPPLGSAAAAGYGVTATFNADGSLASTNDQALTDVINNLTSLAAAGVKTYIIGLGAGVDQTANPIAYATLNAMAIAGGTGSFLPAQSAPAVVNDLNSILSTIQAATQTISAAAVNSTSLRTSTYVYQSQFTSSDAYQDWTGNLFEYPINATGTVLTGVGNAVWAAATQLDAEAAAGTRIIATWDPVAGAGAPFEWTGGTPTAGIASSTVLGQDLETFAADENGSDVVSYLRGVTTKELRNGGQFRNRAHILGDIVNSNPLYIGAPGGNSQTSSYATFSSTNSTRPGIVYVGANDGMLHAFDAATGNERFAYIPRGVYGKLIDLVAPIYNVNHQFFVNGSPQASDVQFGDGSWHTVLVGTEGAGGNSVFALDVTNPAAIGSEANLASVVLWDFTDGDMGDTYSNPAIVNTAVGWVAFVGNGYDSPNQKPVLYALNPQTGAVIAKIDLCASVTTSPCNTSLTNGLSSVTAVNSGGVVSAPANLVYAGDLQGNLWRVDVSSTTPSSWVVSAVFQARDSSGNPQPITTTPVVTLNPKYPQTLGTMVLFGTGQLLSISDLGNAQVETIYGVYDPPAGYATPITRSSLVQQQLSSAMIGTQQVDIVTNNAVSIPTTKGWYIDLSLNPGERIINDPVLEDGALVVTSTVPSTSACAAGGSSYLYIINYKTGSSFPTPQFDATGNGVINNQDLVQNANGTTSVPIGMSLGSVEASQPTILNCPTCSNNNPNTRVKLITQSNGTIKSVIEAGPSKHRTAWWGVRQ